MDLSCENQTKSFSAFKWKCLKLILEETQKHIEIKPLNKSAVDFKLLLSTKEITQMKWKYFNI